MRRNSFRFGRGSSMVAGFDFHPVKHWTPKYLPKLALWMNPEHGLTVDDGRVTDWTSVVGDFTFSATGDARPTTDTINGITIPEFDGEDQFLTYAGQVTAATQGTVFAVCERRITSAGARGIFTQSQGTTNQNFGGQQYGALQNRVAFNVSGTNSSGAGHQNLSMNTPHLLTTTSIGSAWLMWAGTTPQTVTVGQGTGGVWFGHVPSVAFSRIGALRFNNGDLWQFPGIIAEIIVMDKPASVLDRRRVWRYLNDKYALGL